jgi:FKBP-type peptidyl-prolyl cis-trans isomerase
MRFRLIVLLALASALPVRVAAAQESPAIKSQKKATAPKQQVTSTLNDENSKRNYAVGVSIGDSLKKQRSIDLDQDLLLRGLKDSLSGSKLLLTEDEVRATLTNIENELRARQFLAAKELAEKNKKDGEEFLAANKGKEGVVTLTSGLQYKILKAGDGKKPGMDEQVVCHYRATFIDGTEFDNSHNRNQPATVPLRKAIKGWSEALQLMPAGSKWQLFIPPQLAYGQKGSGGTIGPNSTVIFEVELISVQPAPDAAGSKGGS